MPFAHAVRQSCVVPILLPHEQPIRQTLGQQSPCDLEPEWCRADPEPVPLIGCRSLRSAKPTWSGAPPLCTSGDGVRSSPSSVRSRNVTSGCEIVREIRTVAEGASVSSTVASSPSTHSVPRSSGRSASITTASAGTSHRKSFGTITTTSWSVDSPRCLAADISLNSTWL